MTSISRRRANMAMRIVLRISSAAATSRMADDAEDDDAHDAGELLHRPDGLEGEDDLPHARTRSRSCLPSAEMTSASDDAGATLKLRRQRSRSTASSSSGWSAKQRLELLVGRLLVDERRRLRTSGLLLERLAAPSRAAPAVASGFMKTMNSMPPFQRAVALPTPWQMISAPPTSDSDTATVSIDAMVRLRLRHRLRAGLPGDVVDLEATPGRLLARVALLVDAAGLVADDRRRGRAR